MGTPGAVDTSRTKQRRDLRFADSAAMWADIERIVESERAGTLRRAGNWTVGQSLGHLATWAELPYDGYPPELKPPWWLKFIMRPFKDRFLGPKGSMPPGVRIPGVPGGTIGTEPMETEAAIERLRRAWARLEAAHPGIPNPVFGELTHQQWIRLNLGHAELHLGFLHPGAAIREG
ncbi:MAG: DUF1569 domain-containing protein [Phycisphaeraceae bacterium]|nr:DUF1569 domain-containing protein [Phycisphaeraceae bacterium]